ncbi:hypothetical protein, conserved [Trypanosoma brucei gambiense DAL972]|uniref:Uncharacterized protein n=2 Tax=Trypanosoma brucei TaxID=5691 RepID=C9ZT12_TRYB9|nr:hypothetical protein, conserved [Trypanosoma brucei gambiense DAL972]RHW71735.1 hypothetical protein DPX39_070051700 [Trypanosoma brucei equiperdum]CBH12547.1 hypothetical protein, conserved [Trypanosoma brucei gambiense DAL972]|eukprot:XP_011774827.1 hypothetical protein, conserved [Trypanosoma brucei gambiense DAL972]
MVVHLTPLKRPQLLDLCGLTGSVLRAVAASAQINGSANCPPSSESSNGNHHPHPNGHSGDDGITSNKEHIGGDRSGKHSRCEHPLMCGTFCDVLEDPYTKDTWRLHDKMLYLVWWSHRPTSCTNCGTQDAWLPSEDSELKCWNCGTGAGTTADHDIVEERFDEANMSEEEEGGPDRSMVEGETSGGFATGDNNAVVATGGSAVSLYSFFYEWISVLQSTKQLSGIRLPKGECLSQVLRAAYDLAMLFVLPGTPGSGAMAMWGGALFLSLTLYRYAVPFPLFQLGGQLYDLRESPKASSDNRERIENLQWVDVELLSSLIGVVLPDFFESCSVGEQYMCNVMTVTAQFGVPSCIWHPRRISWYQDSILLMKKRRRLPTQTHGTPFPSEISPEHTAMIALLELARLFDSKPSSASVSARVGKWLDENGLYPQRTSYRSKECGDENLNDDNQQPNAAEAAGNASIPAAEEDTAWACGSLTTTSSPFAGAMHHVLQSPCANALLYMFAEVFSIPALELADMASSSGMYGGPVRTFEVLRDSACSGNYGLVPLSRRISPIVSPWTSVYFAIHSNDRLPFLAALQHVRSATSREKEIHFVRLIQAILRKHQSTRRYQFNYTINVKSEKSMSQIDGTYFLCYVAEQFAVFAAIGSAQRTLTFDSTNKSITFNSPQLRDVEVELIPEKRMSSSAKSEKPHEEASQASVGQSPHFRGHHHDKFQNNQYQSLPGAARPQSQRDAHRIHIKFSGPVIANVESSSAKCVIDCARQDLGSVQWQSVVRRLERCGRIRRRMRVPMLASRLDALASVRESTAMTSHPMNGSSTLGWRDTESLFGSTHHMLYVSQKYTATTLRREVQQDVLSLLRPSLVFGMSESRVVTMYAALIALLEITDRQLGSQARTSPRVPGGPPARTWLDELLSKEEWNFDDRPTQKTLNDTPSPPYPSRDTNGGGDAMVLPASTAAVQREQQDAKHRNSSDGQQRCPNGSRHSTQCNATTEAFPSYEEVLMGRVKMITNGAGGRNSGTRFLRFTKSQKQRRPCTEGSAGGVSVDNPSASAVDDPSNLNFTSFNLFKAEICRRRLYRLLCFIDEYKRKGHAELKRPPHEIRADTHMAVKAEDHKTFKREDSPPLYSAQTPNVCANRSPRHSFTSARKSNTPLLGPQSNKTTPTTPPRHAISPIVEPIKLPPQAEQSVWGCRSSGSSGHRNGDNTNHTHNRIYHTGVGDRPPQSRASSNDGGSTENRKPMGEWSSKKFRRTK